MKNLLKTKRRKFNSKKGITLVELIVAVMILLIVVSASVRGLTLSYRSASLGALKNDAQSVAQRDCDFIMSAIATVVENETFDALTKNTLNNRLIDHGTHCEIDNNFHSLISQDASIDFLTGGYNEAKFSELIAVSQPASNIPSIQQANYNHEEKQYHYYTITREDKALKAGSSDVYQIYKITTYVYYSEKGFVTCEGEVCILPKTS